MKFLLWFVAGIAAISVAFYLPGKGPDLWPNVNAAGIAAAAYLTLLMGFILRKPIPAHTRVVSWIMFAILACVITLGWRTAYAQSRYQRERLHAIAHTIGHGVLSDAMHRTLLKTLDTYYKENPQTAPGVQPSLSAIFLRSFPNAAPGIDIADSLIAPMTVNRPDTTNRVYITSLSDTLIVLTGQSQLPGLSSSFQNYNGRHGLVQHTSSLTVKGLTDVVDN